MLNLFIIVICLFLFLILFFYFNRNRYFPAQNPAEKNLLYYFFLFILFTGILLRIININFNSFWIDELFSINMALKSSIPDIIEECRNDVHPPLFNLILFFYVKIAGDSETASRLLSAVFGILSATGVYLLATALFNSKRALAVMIMFSVAYLPVYYSQEVRSYSLLLLLAIFANYFFLKAFILTEKPVSNLKKIINMILYSVAVISLMLTHYYGITVFIFNVVFMFFYGIISNSKSDLVKKLSVPVSVFVLIALIFYFLWGYNIFQQYQRTFWPKPLDKNFFSAFPFFVMNPNLKSYFIGDVFLKMFSLLMAGFFFYYIAASFKHKIKNEPNNPEYVSILFLFFWMLIPYAVSYLQTVYSNPSISFRNLIVLSPAVIMLFFIVFEKIINFILNFLIIRLNAFKKLANNKNIFVNPLMLSLILSMLLFVKTYGYYANPSKQDIRGLIQEISVNPELNSQSTIIFTTSKTADQLNYYFKRFSHDLRISHYLAGESLQDELIKFQNEIENHRYLILLDIKNWGAESENTINYFKSNHKLITENESGGFSYFIFEKRKSSIPQQTQ